MGIEEIENIIIFEFIYSSLIFLWHIKLVQKIQKFVFVFVFVFVGTDLESIT
jgi:hypothetical protein